IQLYMIWKTNYDEMIEEEREKRRQKMGGLVGNTPLIKPGVTDLKQIHSTDTHMVNLNISPNVVDDEEE
ncbi:MAG: hypothetical protein OEY49_00825, partial [Candidatus Heimdallarchaeota archaeon]|nr:hypothetical protein [Candidatus Heimdallarchaeota archaeon]